MRSVPRVFTERSEVPLVTLNLCVMRRYNIGEGALVSTIYQFSILNCVNCKQVHKIINTKKVLNAYNNTTHQQHLIVKSHALGVKGGRGWIIYIFSFFRVPPPQTVHALQRNILVLQQQ